MAITGCLTSVDVRMAPQTLHVLLCVDCKTFQVHIVKKSTKWNCKICSVKQTITRVYGTGSGPECRVLVQRLNQARGEIKLAADNTVVEKINQEFAAEEREVKEGKGYYLQESETSKNNLEEEAEDSSEDKDLIPQPAKKSKWTVFTEKNSSSGNHLY